MGEKIKVLVVDDSSIIRKLLTYILNKEDDLEVVATAPDPYVAREKLIKLNPDVMTLDIEMPRMDGVTFLRKVMKYHPTPTVMLSSLAQKESEMALRALEAGAVSVLAKPAIDVSRNLQKIGHEIVAHVRAASKANLKAQLETVKRTEKSNKMVTTHQILAIAASTGGTEALKRLLPNLPIDLPGTIIVQHLPPAFSSTFAQKLNETCPFEVREAKDGDRVLPGHVYVIPGNKHGLLTRSGANYHIKLTSEPPVNGVRPSADVMFKSIAKWAATNAIGVILTGMGRDGADGLKTMKDAGSYNIAQNEESCVIYGMPKEAIDQGAIHEVLHLDDIHNSLILKFNEHKKKVA